MKLKGINPSPFSHPLDSQDIPNFDIVKCTASKYYKYVSRVSQRVSLDDLVSEGLLALTRLPVGTDRAKITTDVSSACLDFIKRNSTIVKYPRDFKDKKDALPLKIDVPKCDYNDVDLEDWLTHTLTPEEKAVLKMRLFGYGVVEIGSILDRSAAYVSGVARRAEDKIAENVSALR